MVSVSAVLRLPGDCFYNLHNGYESPRETFARVEKFRGRRRPTRNRPMPFVTTNVPAMPFDFVGFDVRLADKPQKFYRVRQP